MTTQIATPCLHAEEKEREKKEGHAPRGLSTLKRARSIEGEKNPSSTHCSRCSDRDFVQNFRRLDGSIALRPAHTPVVSAHAADVVCARCASSAASTRAVACGPPSVTLRFFPLAYLLPYLHCAYRPLPVLRSARGAARSMRRRLLFPTHWFPRRARPAFARTRTCTAQGKGGGRAGLQRKKELIGFSHAHPWETEEWRQKNGRTAAEFGSELFETSATWPRRRDPERLRQQGRASRRG